MTQRSNDDRGASDQGDAAVGRPGQTYAAARELVRGLRDLRAADGAPATLLPAVLVQVGLRDEYLTLQTPLGLVYVAYNGRGISAVQRASDADSFAAVFAAHFGRALAPAREADAALRRALEAAVRGERHRELRFDLRGLSEFERAVLLKALEIPRGEVRPYGWIAREIGRPLAQRAVGTALKHNPIPLLIPCHRVVRSDGALGQYALGGGEAKRAVLTAEAVDMGELERLMRAGVRYIGSETTHVFCFPTCGGARRITEPHRVAFASAAQAVAAGYRPCKTCRPA